MSIPYRPSMRVRTTMGLVAITLGAACAPIDEAVSPPDPGPAPEALRG